MPDIEFHRPHQSITSFENVALPRVTVVVGINGAGKTHLLQAIANGAINTVGVSQSDIRLYNWETLVPSANQTVAVSSEREDRNHLLVEITGFKEQIRNGLHEILAKADLSSKYPDPFAILDDGEGSDENTKKARARARDLVAKQIALRGTDRVVRLASLLGPRFVNAKDDDIYRFRSRLAPDLFQSSVSRLFLNYHTLLMVNRLRRLARLEHRDEGNPLSDKELEELHGVPPWDFLNESIARIGLDFRFPAPKDYLIEHYTAKLLKASDSVEVDLHALSSGEKILMSLATAIYNNSDQHQIVTRAKLILLDEVDATLHPSMSRKLMGVVVDTISAAGTDVILTTHSPSTVAVAPEGSVYLLEPGRRALTPVSRQQAITLLTRDLPTVSINISGRRQVFVESGLDVERYDALFQAIRNFIPSERSLSFIAAGGASRQASGNGCTQVYAVVESLTLAGNSSIFGLVDWDTSNKRQGNTLVLEDGLRYSIENLLLDPLALAFLLIADGFIDPEELGLQSGQSYVSLQSISVEQRQTIARRIQARVLDKELEGDTEISVEYLDGACVWISKRYMQKRGHDLEESVKTAFPRLRSYRRNNELLLEIIRRVYRDHGRMVVPKSTIDLFTHFLSC